MLNYIIEANIGLTLFIVAYWLVLRNETAFKTARVFLLLGISLSLIFPVLHFQFNGTPLPSLNTVVLPNLLPELTITANGDTVNNFSGTLQSVWLLVKTGYALGICFLTLRFIFQLGQRIPPVPVGIVKVGAVTGRVTTTFGSAIAG